MTTPATATTPAVEEPKFTEHETDHKPSKGKAHPNVSMNPFDATLNCLVDSEGSIISQVQSDGMNMLLAQVRGDLGIKKGRYYYEVQVLEQQANRMEFMIGVSAAASGFLGTDNLSIAFDQHSNVRTNGETTNLKIKAVQKHQVVGILLNMDAKLQNKYTISMFIDGKRACEPQALPEAMHKCALFPTIAFRGCSIATNLRTQLRATPFTVAMWANASMADSEKSTLKKEEDPKAVYPIGLSPEDAVADYKAKNSKDQYIELSKAYFDTWIKASNVTKKSEFAFGITCLDTPAHLAPWIRSRNRHVIWALGTLMFSEERERTLKLLPHYTKTAIITKMPTKTDRVYHKYATASLPVAGEEGDFANVIFSCDKKEAEEALELWKKDQRLRSKVENLKVGEFFKERAENQTKFVTEKKATEEGKNFTDEDWMLFNARSELSSVVHAFKADVDDETRPSFPPTLAQHYYKLYSNKALNPAQFACQTVEQLIVEHLNDCVEVDTTGLVNSKVEKEIEFEKIFALVENEREARETRVGAGDELSALKFSANQKVMPQGQKGGNKGFGKGIKRPGVQLQSIPQRIRQA